MDFEMSLKEKNLKVTPQRIAILREIQKNGHIAVDDIYENIKKDYPSISLATVYKNITALYEVNILREIKAPAQKQRYELSYDHHLHVACEKCGKLEDIKVDVSEVSDKCSKMTGYILHDASAVFIGLCPECASRNKK
ncbi:Fur family transcriptional regulator [Helicobacter cappadocius]|uniref:Fur family transcriptional regulator n=1 Tax=Helicobacter cappadocius TaxID=3063998 RepID=A0AA90PJQ2_9HELI|nr:MULTISPECIES: Fur family transcriptional regulator [unclassified Helicobacter]MDO7253252.1 Fur family transcriptional regulator [Helicobacter sp. faydin-H75]MDP2539176.1 Fur family transcriptional regulator [Helicobacter sp. faydin-H76]